MKIIKEIMLSDPKYCYKNESLKNAVKEMSKSRIGSLPVLDSDKKVVGILTSRDVCATLGKTDKPYADIKVHEAMMPEAYTCNPEDDINTVLRIMRTKKVRRLPVVDKKGHLKGVLSLNTITREYEDSEERAEVEYEGKESIMKTFRSISDRNYEQTERDTYNTFIF